MIHSNRLMVDFFFFTEVCEALKVEIEDYVEENEEATTLPDLYLICAGNFERMLSNAEESAALIKIRGLPMFLMVEEKHRIYLSCLSFYCICLLLLSAM